MGLPRLLVIAIAAGAFGAISACSLIVDFDESFLVDAGTDDAIDAATDGGADGSVAIDP
jgi:hypothetical protein